MSMESKGADLANPLLGSRKAWSCQKSRGFFSQKGLILQHTVFLLTFQTKSVFIFAAAFQIKSYKINIKILTN